MLRPTALLPLLTLTCLGVAQERIVTDRPDFTESSLVVPLKRLQLESGFTYQSLRFSAPELLLRYGLAPRSELRLGLPDYKSSETYLGAKFQLDGFALIPAVTLSSSSSDPELKICWSTEIGGGWSVASMAYGLWTDRTFVFQPTVSFGKSLADRVGMFIEYAGTFIRTEQPDHVAHLGFTYQPTPNTQFDINGGFSMNGRDRNPFIAAGYSVRF